MNPTPFEIPAAGHELDRLLNQAGSVGDVPESALRAARSALVAEAESRRHRALRIARLRRRHRRLSASIAVAAVGVVAVTLVSTRADRPSEPSAAPGVGTSSGPDSMTAPVEAQFTTVAQVIDAASSAAASEVDPTGSPYWKVVTAWDCSGVPDSAGVERPAGSTCEQTIWTGNRRQGVLQSADGDTIGIPAGTVSINGRSVAWATANARHLSPTEIASMVADNADNSDGTKADRAPSAYYVFKNTFEVLATAPASGAIRAELWRQLAAVEGVTFNGRATDSRGRSGWRLTWGTGAAHGWGEQSIIVDTTTGTPLETSDRAPGAAAWNVSTIVSAGPAATAPDVMSQKEIQRLQAAAREACGVDSRASRGTWNGTGLDAVERERRTKALTPAQEKCLSDELADVPLLHVGW